jgi:cytochrome c oxidase cbb3-type subunit 2
VRDRRIFVVLGLVAAATGCPGEHAAAPVAAAPVVVTPAARAPTPPPVTRRPVVEWPLEAPVERGDKPASDAALLERGKQLFATNCTTCHGVDGKGDGPAAFAAQPRPRNFTKGIFKIHSNENGSLPTDEDLFDTITRGMGGTAMPRFERLPAADRWALVAHVKELSVFRDPEEDPPVEVHFFKERPATPPLQVGAPRPATPALLATGKTAFLKLDCNKCHGATGDGNGPSASDLKDDWGEEIWPRNFQEGRYRYVSSLRDVVHRVNTGLSGTPMAAFGSTQLTDEERWGLAHFLSSLRKGEPKAEAPANGLMVASRSAQPIPGNLRQPRFWLDVPLYEVALQGDGPKTARVAVQRDAKNLVVLVAYDDAIADGRPAVAEEFQDRVTVKIGSDAQTLTGIWAEGEWRALFVRPLAGLEGKTLDVAIEVEDHTTAGVKKGTSASLRLAVP